VKVLILEPNSVLSYGTNLANALADLRIDVMLATTHDYPHAAFARVPVSRIGPPTAMRGYADKAVQELAYVGRAIRLLRHFRPDVVHVQWLRWRLEIALLAALRLAGVPIVFTVHNVMPHEPSIADYPYHWMLYRLADRLIAHTDGTCDELVRGFRLRQSRIAVIPHGRHEFLNHVLSAQMARGQLELSPTATVFLLYGWVRPYKGWEELLAAFEQAVRQDVDAVLVIAGRASVGVAARLRREVASFSDAARGRVQLHLAIDSFLGQEETDRVFSAADVVVLPYRRVSQSGVLFQAFSYGRPVLVSAVGGFRETIHEGENGYLFPPGDVAALGRRIGELTQRRSELSACGERAQKTASITHDWHRIAELTREVYYEAANSARARIRY
jgi:glycosyltransferase involved in cell wall biosynthesis